MYAYIDAHSQILIDECLGYGVRDISILIPQCANMTYSDQIRYIIMFQQVIYKGGEPAINYIKRFHNTKALEISVGNNYTEYKPMHTLLDNFQQGGNYSAQIASQQAKLKREEKFIDKTIICI